MMSGSYSSFLLFLCLTTCKQSQAGQSCLDKQQIVVAIRHMQQFLRGQESRFVEGMRYMKNRLTTLQNSVSKASTESDHHIVTCPLVDAPVNGRKFGTKLFVDHEVHFTCNSGFLLIGPSTRVCQENGSWTGDNPVCKDISECSSHPCQNGGTCVDGINQYRCVCSRGWTGTNCQYQTETALPEWSVMNDPAFSRKPRCAKVDRTQHCSCEPGFHMSGTSENSICQDVNECEVYKLDGVPKLCMHACVNIPGSYRCSCPTGYKILGDGRSCEDVDECLTSQHNCTRGTMCINTGGGFQCVNPECPKSHGNISYVKTFPFQCERNPCPMDSRSCHLAPKTISFHYLSLPTKLKTPVTLFRMATAAAPGRPGPDSLRFGIVGGNSRGHFVMQRSDRQTGELILVQSFQGPLIAEVDVDMSEYLDRTFQAKHVSKVTVFVSPYEF
ncbi:fibulin-7 [Latimeria chalumnae]|uniref:fibulin-7 n=1 Tax=Latimeria chalumnae TaxID=7897 RepID=UPI0003C14666|nr:PREDICTED: fibulin-7 [Latimeria chalumnae]XP_014342458.1 PREDICTED: fibulin-7 [Latimeria chalumnae]|eukprot:XP_005993601.1 PREDICTED: fibulin-7 [Latimeria chalumnae]